MDPSRWDAPYPVIVAVLFCIVLARSNATYWAGRLVANGATHTRAARWMETPGYRRAVTRLNTWGAPVVAASFLTVGVQTLINLAAGASRMPLGRYLAATVAGSTAWAFLYGTVGLVGFESLALLWEYSPAATVGAGSVASGGLVWFILRQARHSRLGVSAEAGTPSRRRQRRAG